MWCYTFSCGRPEAEAEGCGGTDNVYELTESGAREVQRGTTALALRLDPARDLQRLHALLVAHAPRLDDRLLRPQGTRTRAAH